MEDACPSPCLLFDVPNFFLAQNEIKRYLGSAMRRTRKHAGALALLALFLGLFWIVPSAHKYAVLHEAATEHDSCAAVCGGGAHANDASEAPSETAHDPDTCSICRLAALPYALHIYPNPQGICPYPAPERTSPARADFIALRYEGFSFGARAPPNFRA